MKISKLPHLSALVGILALCSATVTQGHIRELPGILHLPAATVDIPIGDLGETESKFLITTLAQYEQLFGEGATGVDFKTQWAFFYSAGLQPTAGYEASVTDIAYTQSAESLVISTELDSPGVDCAVAQHITKPYTLVKFPKPPGNVDVVRVAGEFIAVDCGGGDGNNVAPANPIIAPR